MKRRAQWTTKWVASHPRPLRQPGEHMVFVCTSPSRWYGTPVAPRVTRPAGGSTRRPDFSGLGVSDGESACQPDGVPAMASQPDADGGFVCRGIREELVRTASITRSRLARGMCRRLTATLIHEASPSNQTGEPATVGHREV